MIEVAALLFGLVVGFVLGLRYAKTVKNALSNQVDA